MIAEVSKATAKNAGVFVLASSSRLTKEHDKVKNMKLEVKYEIKEITKFVICKTVSLENNELVSNWWEVGDGDFHGEFRHKSDAEKVRDALEADIARKVRGAL